MRWKAYLSELFEDKRLPKPDSESSNVNLKIIRTEIEYALETMKPGKAAGPDQVPIQISKLFDDDVIDILLDLFNLIYDRGEIPKQWFSLLLCLYPRNRIRGYVQTREPSHTLTLFLKIIHKKIYGRHEEDISNTQFGFRDGLGSREALFGINVIFQRCLDINQDIYACFIDFEKAYYEYSSSTTTSLPLRPLNTRLFN